MAVSEKRRTRRQHWLLIHQVLGLVLGFFLSILGLSGSLALIGESSERWMHPTLIIDESNTIPASLDTIFISLKSLYPEFSGSWALEMPLSPDDPLLAIASDSSEFPGDEASTHMIWIDPYTGEILRKAAWGETLRSWTQRLHTCLQLGEFGEWLVGVLGLLLSISLISGLYLWWPGFQKIQSLWVLRRHQRLKAFCQDFHRLIGSFAAAPLLVLALTGVCLAFPKVLEGIMGTEGMSHGARGPRVGSTGNQGAGRRVSIDEAVLLARGPFPSAEVREIKTPANPSDTYRVSFRQSSDPSRRHPITSVWVDQYSGQIREVRNASKLNFREQMIGSLWPLHTGESHSIPMKIVWFFTGLSLPLLFWSGLTRWRIEKGALRDQPLEETGWFRAAKKFERLSRFGWNQTRASLINASMKTLRGLHALFLSWLQKP